MINSSLVQFQEIFRKEFKFQSNEILSGDYALNNIIYPNLNEFVNKSLPNLINSMFEESTSPYTKQFFLDHLNDFFTQFFQRRSQLIFHESEYCSRNLEKSHNSLINDKYYYKKSSFFENLFINLEDGFKLEFRLTYKESKKEGKEKRNFFFILEKDLNPVLYNPSEKILTIYFQYRKLLEKEVKGSKRSIQKTIKNLCYNSILKSIQDPTLLNILKNKHKSDKSDNLSYYLDLYYSKNDSESFLYKHLGKYLKVDLKNYIQEQLLPIMLNIFENSINFEILKKNIKSFEFISNEIIDLLAKIEEIKKKLFLKKKFVSNTNYGISLIF